MSISLTEDERFKLRELVQGGTRPSGALVKIGRSGSSWSRWQNKAFEDPTTEEAALVDELEDAWYECKARQVANVEAFGNGYVEIVTEEVYAFEENEETGEREPKLMRRTVRHVPRRDWKASMALLERFWPEEFAPKMKLDARDGEGNEAEVYVLSAETVQALKALPVAKQETNGNGNGAHE